jgi:hypothetical protein
LPLEDNKRLAIGRMVLILSHLNVGG